MPLFLPTKLSFPSSHLSTHVDLPIYQAFISAQPIYLPSCFSYLSSYPFCPAIFLSIPFFLSTQQSVLFSHLSTMYLPSNQPSFLPSHLSTHAILPTYPSIISIHPFYTRLVFLSTQLSFLSSYLSTRVVLPIDHYPFYPATLLSSFLPIYPDILSIQQTLLPVPFFLPPRLEHLREQTIQQQTTVVFFPVLVLASDFCLPPCKCYIHVTLLFMS